MDKKSPLFTDIIFLINNHDSHVIYHLLSFLRCQWPIYIVCTFLETVLVVLYLQVCRLDEYININRDLLCCLLQITTLIFIFLLILF